MNGIIGGGGMEQHPAGTILSNAQLDCRLLDGDLVVAFIKGKHRSNFGKERDVVGHFRIIFQSCVCTDHYLCA